MVRISRPPTVYIIPKIDEQGLRRGEDVWDAILAHVLVITLAVLVVVAQNATAIHHQSEPILKAVLASCYGQWQPPNHHFHESVFGNNVALVKHEFSIHVGDNTNTYGCCQTLQQILSGFPWLQAPKSHKLMASGCIKRIRQSGARSCFS
jgi:hypothetical protein